MINILRKITPKFVLRVYHYLLARLADLIYGHPSGKLIVWVRGIVWAVPLLLGFSVALVAPLFLLESRPCSQGLES